ncbi:MAG: glutathione S-transferase family protein [Roseobacter sp.]
MVADRYILHYAPDNASLVIRLALEELTVPYDTCLVDRSVAAQRGAVYLALNPNGLIPVLETKDGPIFETAAILLWLADRHGGLAPPIESPARADCLKWLFFMSNTLHPALRRRFNPSSYIGDDVAAQAEFNHINKRQIDSHLRVLNDAYAAQNPPLILSLYLGPMVRWLALYPCDTDKSWFDLAHYPALKDIATMLEDRPSTQAAILAEGLGDCPFTAPQPPNPPEGVAL